MKSRELVVSTKLTMPLAVPPSPIPFFEAGGTTFHQHTCPVTQHPWRCNSPYCTILTEPCPDHGGEEPVKIGTEPWKR